MTDLMDTARYPALELAALYHERWEIELAFDDIKSEQRAATVTLRSKTPEGIRQEIYGLLLAHNLVRVEMASVAAELGVAPTRISFHRALHELADGLRGMTGTAPTRWPAWEGLLRTRLMQLVLPERRTARSFPRAMKMPVGRYARKLPAAR